MSEGKEGAIGAVSPLAGTVHSQQWGSQLRGSLLPALSCWGSQRRGASLHHPCSPSAPTPVVHPLSEPGLQLLEAFPIT